MRFYYISIKKEITNYNSISLNGSDYKIKEKLSEFPGTIGSATANIMDTYYAVVKDEKEATKLATKLTELSSKELEKRGISIQTGTPTLQNYVAFNIKEHY